jgi:hypothetical protein
MSIEEHWPTDYAVSLLHAIIQVTTLRGRFGNQRIILTNYTYSSKKNKILLTRLTKLLYSQPSYHETFVPQ